MGFILYHSGGDDQIFVDDQGKKHGNAFKFTGFGNGIHPYHRTQLNWIIQMLGSAGIILNLREVPTVYDMGGDPDKGEFEAADIKKPNDLKVSSDGKVYYMLQDVEMGRGWAVLMCDDEIIRQDHRDNIRYELLDGDFIRSFGVDYQQKKVESLSKIK